MNSQDFHDSAEPVYDIVGIGFGPANLALAIAIDEHNRSHPESDRLAGLFLEKQETFSWHQGMLIDGATMQVSFLKDLVTLRNPASDYSFLCYLRDRERLVDFINHKTLFPTRVEYHDYLEWAASRLDHQVRYNSEVISITPVHGHGEVEQFDVVARQDGEIRSFRARNVVLGLGLEADVPEGVQLGEHVWHNLDLLDQVEGLRGAQGSDVGRFTVVGAGQSAAETVEYLHRTFPNSEVCAVFRRYGYSPSDDSPFANRIFDPQAVRDFYAAPDDVKRMLLDYHGNTNYSVVDVELIEQLYSRVYQEKVVGQQRLRVCNASQVRAVENHSEGVRVTVEFMPTGEIQELDSDVLVYATGCRPRDPSQLLGNVAEYCAYDDRGLLRVAPDYRVRTTDQLAAGIYLQGGTEHTHGITSSLLSNGAVRAGEIRDAVLAARHGLDGDDQYQCAELTTAGADSQPAAGTTSGGARL